MKTRKPTKTKSASGRKTALAMAGKKSAAPAKAAKASRAPARKPAPPPVDPEAMMAAWQKAMTPAAGHRWLEPLAGTFTARTTFWMAPGAPPAESTGLSEHRWVLGGRFLEQIYRGSMNGMPFEGIGYTGFDNVQGKYVGSWMDSFGTGIMSSIGTGKPTAKEMVFESECREPGSKVPTCFRSFIRIEDRDRHSFEMWRLSPSGKPHLCMRVEYIRK